MYLVDDGDSKCRYDAMRGDSLKNVLKTTMRIVVCLLYVNQKYLLQAVRSTVLNATLAEMAMD